MRSISTLRRQALKIIATCVHTQKEYVWAETLEDVERLKVERPDALIISWRQDDEVRSTA